MTPQERADAIRACRQGLLDLLDEGDEKFDRHRAHLRTRISELQEADTLDRELRPELYAVSLQRGDLVIAYGSTTVSRVVNVDSEFAVVEWPDGVTNRHPVEELKKVQLKDVELWVKKP